MVTDISKIEYMYSWSSTTPIKLFSSARVTVSWPIENNQLGQVKPTFQLSEAGRYNENFSNTDQIFRSKLLRFYIPTLVGVVKPRARHWKINNHVSPTDCQSQSPVFSLLQEHEKSVTTTTLGSSENSLSKPINYFLRTLSKSNVNQLLMQDIPANSTIQQKSLESHLNPLNQPVDPDPLLPKSIDGTCTIEINSYEVSRKTSKSMTLSESEMLP